MKYIIPLISLMCQTALTSQAQGAEVPAALMNFPADGMRLTGESVAPEPTAEFLKMQQAVSARLQAMPLEQKLAFFENYSPNTLMPYSADFWSNRADYDKYASEWKKMGIKQLQTVQLGAFERGNNEWSLHGVVVNTFTRQVQPLTVCGLVYHADRNVWTSSNGELTPMEHVTGSDNVYGARKGTAWSLRKEDALSRISEQLAITRRTNGEYLYLSYNFSERATGSGTVLAQGNYVLRFRIGPPAPDPEEPSAAPELTPQPEEAAANDEPKKKSRKKRRHRRKRRR